MRVSLAPVLLCAHPYRYCAKGGATNICTNKQLQAAKAKNEIPNFSAGPSSRPTTGAGPTVVGAGVKGLPKTPKKVKVGAVPSV